MVNIYKCEQCGSDAEIPYDHVDNKKVNVAGILYIDNCSKCHGEYCHCVVCQEEK